jgi:O-antigen ligase
MNVGSVLLGFQSEGQLSRYTREFEAIFNPFGARVNFPFTFSGQFFAIMGGVIVIASIYLMGEVKYFLAALILMMVGIFVLIGQSARAPILALAIVLAYRVVPDRIRRPTTIFVICVIFIVPLAFIHLDAGLYLQQIFSELGINFERSDGDIASLSNRNIIWGSALAHMLNKANPVQVLFGYGAYGQISSGIINDYRWLFEASYSTAADRPSFHSSYLQIFVDSGALGVLLLWGVIIFALRSLRDHPLRSDNKTSGALFYVLLYIIICSVTETCLTYQSTDILALFIFINLYAMALRESVICGNKFSILDKA